MTTKEVNRVKILEVAKTLFIEKGFKDTSMNDVAINANLGRKTIYRHFDNKDLLLIAIISEYFFEFGNALKRTKYEDYFNAFDKIEFLLSKYGEFFQENLPMLQLIGMMDINIDGKSRLTDIYTLFIEYTKIPDVVIQELIIEGMEDLSIKKLDRPELTTLTINNSLLSLASRVFGHKDSLDSEQGIESWKMVEELASILLQGIKNS